MREAKLSSSPELHIVGAHATATVAHSEEEACKLVESGFEFISDFNGDNILKRK